MTRCILFYLRRKQEEESLDVIPESVWEMEIFTTGLLTTAGLLQEEMSQDHTASFCLNQLNSVTTKEEEEHCHGILNSQR